MDDEREPVIRRPSSVGRRPFIARQSSSRALEFEASEEAAPYSGAGTAADGERSIVEVEVVPELCMSFLNCMRIATGAFGTDRASRRTRATQRWKNVDASKLWRAAWSCPTGAIRFVTDKGYVNPRWEEASQWSVGAHPAAGLRRESAQEPSKP